MEEETFALEGPIIRRRLKRIQEKVQHNLVILKDQGEDQEGYTLYHFSSCLVGNDRIVLNQGCITKSMIILVANVFNNKKETFVMIPRQWVLASHDGRRTLSQIKEDELPSEVIRKNNLYKIDLTDLAKQNVTCMDSINVDPWTWHKKLGHASFLMRSLPSLVYKVDMLCDACQKGKQIKRSFESKNVVSTSRPLELLHIDFFGSTKIVSLGGKHYELVVVDDYSRWT
ncbi:hypothetical protein CR513_29823, partial [Mucuna pruriens]